MEIVRLTPEHLPDLLRLAAGEGWISDRWEFDFLLKAFPDGCFAGLCGGVPAAFVTAITYGTSGWIGNLLVRPDRRRRGYGRLLMARARAALAAAGAETIWLTASAAGKPLYTTLGFSEIDRVARWCGRGRGERFQLIDEPLAPAELAALDGAGWGDRRERLLAALRRRGCLAAGAGAFLLAQQWPHGIQFGPWAGRDTTAAAGLFGRALAGIATETPVFLDVPERNEVASLLVRAAGFTLRGENALMYAGRRPDYRPESVYALASTGGMG